MGAPFYVINANSLCYNLEILEILEIWYLSEILEKHVLVCPVYNF